LLVQGISNGTFYTNLKKNKKIKKYISHIYFYIEMDEIFFFFYIEMDEITYHAHAHKDTLVCGLCELITQLILCFQT
jgi:hypothetical protein